MYRAAKGRLMDILIQLFIQEYSNERTFIQEQIPSENNPLLKFYDVQLRHATA